MSTLPDIALRLARDGAAVVPLSRSHLGALGEAVEFVNGPLPEKTTPGISRFWPITDAFGETHPGSHPGFGSSALPSTMHNEMCQALHKVLREEVFEPLMAELVAVSPEVRRFVGSAPNYAYLYDRWCQRLHEWCGKAVRPGRETKHRDVNPDVLGEGRDVLCFGGWVNADPPGSEPQLFSHSPGSHIIGRLGEGWAPGFATSRTEYEGFRMEKILVPPGHALVFFENIVHEVLSARRPDMLRLFTACQIWRGPVCELGRPCKCPTKVGQRKTRPCFPCMQVEMCRSKTLTHVKSGQENRVFPKLYPVNYPHLLKAICLQVPGLRHRTTKDGRSIPVAVHPPVEGLPDYPREDLEALLGYPLRPAARQTDPPPGKRRRLESW